MGRCLATGRGGRYDARRGLSRRMACSLARVSIGIEGRWVIGCSSCWTAVRRECSWRSSGESRSYCVEGLVGGEGVGGLYLQYLHARLRRCVYMGETVG